MRFLTAAIVEYSESSPFDKNVNKYMASARVPNWFAISSLHRAICRAVGPYMPPEQTYKVEFGELLVEFEIKQPPAGTPQAEHPRTRWFAILDINCEFVTPGSNMYCQIDPTAAFVPGDDVAVWFSHTNPAEIIGRFRDNEDVDTGIGPRTLPGFKGFNP